VVISLQNARGLWGYGLRFKSKVQVGQHMGISQWKKEQIYLNDEKLLVEQVSTNYYSKFCYSLATIFSVILFLN
jgi:hypothetical protein